MKIPLCRFLCVSAFILPPSAFAAVPESFVHPQPALPASSTQSVAGVAAAFPFSFWKTTGIATPTPTPTPSASPTPNDYALLFSGSSQYVTIPNHPLDTNSDFTIEAWVKLGANGNNVVFSGKADANNYWCFIIRNDGNGICFQEAVANPSATFILSGSGTVTVAEGWTHVALTRSGNNWAIYKNGSSFKTATNSATGLSAGGQEIAGLAGLYNGRIDEVRIWNVARTGTEINDNKSLVLPYGTTNLIGYWRFETGSGTTAFDSITSGGNNGTFVGSVTWTTDKPF